MPTDPSSLGPADPPVGRSTVPGTAEATALPAPQAPLTPASISPPPAPAAQILPTSPEMPDPTEDSSSIPAVANRGSDHRTLAPPETVGTGRSLPPQPLDTGEHRLDPEWVTLERIGAFIGVTIVALVTFIAAGAGSLIAGPWWPLVIAAWSLFMLLLAARAWFWPKFAYKHRSYRLDERGLVIRRGVFWRSVAHVPRSRVQHTDVSQGPLERYFELGTLTVHTAGTQFASVALDGLNHQEAQRIRDVLIEAGEGDGV